MFETFAAPIIKGLSSLAKNEASAFLQNLLTNARAEKFAREQLRSKYETKVAPAVYEHIVSNFHLEPQDFVNYFKTVESPSLSTLREYLRSQLRTRASNWVHNRPTEQVFEEMVEDFYRAYEVFFITTDPALTTLEIFGASQEILSLVRDIRTTLSAGQIQAVPPESSSLLQDITLLLTTLQLPFELLEKTVKHADIKMVDVSGMFPAEILICAVGASSTTDLIDNLLDRGKTYGRFSHVFLITETCVDPKMAAYAERRSVVTMPLREFREQLLRLSPAEHYIVGQAAITILLESLAVREVYIEPTCAPIIPGAGSNDVEMVRTPAFPKVDDFLSDPKSSLLFVLGEYGCGKSAFVAQIAQRTLSNPGVGTPVYIALRQVKQPDDLPTITAKASRLAKMATPDHANSIVILDGVDELPNAMKPEERRQNMLRLLSASRQADKIIVTARSSYFRGLDDFWDLFSRAGENPLWTKLSRNLSHAPPNVAALVLHDFNNDQIQQYIRGFAKHAAKPPEFVETFLQSFEKHDPLAMYRFIARSPLYLFLLVNTEPWRDPNVKCSADVIALLIKFWLERDIEKGPSRWGLSTFDRLDFMTGLAWWMFNEDKVMLSFKEFDGFVQRFYAGGAREHALLTIDLHTTGLFGCSGNQLHFVLPAFCDYLVARQFADVAFPDGDPPKRLPTTNQALIWLGLVEVGRTAEKSWTSNNIRMIETLIESADAEPVIPLRNGLPATASGILYHVEHGDWPWPVAQSAKGSVALRILMAALRSQNYPGTKKLRVLIANQYGLHARPSALLVTSVNQWRESSPAFRKVELELSYGGATVDAASMMGVMMLAVGRGAVVDLMYKGCSEPDIEGFLALLSAKRVPEGERFDWRIDSFGGE